MAYEITNYSITNYELRNSQGFSLIELMFAIVFLSIIVLGVTKLQTSNLVLSKTNVNEADAYFWANQGIEIADALGYGAIPVCASYPCTQYLRFDAATNSYAFSDVPESPLGVIFNRSILLDNTDLINAYKVTSRVEWQDITGEHTCDAENSSCVEVKRVVF